VGGDHLLVLDVSGVESLLDAATWVHPRATFIAVANEQCRGLGHLVLRSWGRRELSVRL
jgi:hypothetical protein